MSTDVAALAIKVESMGADQAQQQLDALTSSAGRTESATGLLESGFRRLTGALAGLLAAERVVAFLNNSAAAAGRLQSSLTSASGAMGFTSTQMRALEDASRRLASGTTFSSEQVGAAFEAIAQDAGGLADTPQQLEAITSAAVRLATATRSDLNDAGSTLVTLLRQFGGSADQAANAITELGSTAPELQEVAAAFGAVGNTAAQLGITVPETAAALKILGDAGLEGANAGTALRGVLMQLEAEADANLRPSVVGLEAALRGAVDAQVEWSDRSFAASQILVKASGEFRETTDAIRDSDRATQLAEQSMGTYEAQVAAMAAAFGTLSAEVGKSVTPGLGDAAQAATYLAEQMTELLGSTAASSSDFSLMAEAANKASAMVYGLASGFVALGENLAGATATAAAFLTLDFEDAGNRWDLWMDDREARALKFETEFNRMWDGVQDRIRRTAAEYAPEVETFGGELDATANAIAASVGGSVRQYGAVAASDAERERRAQFTASDGQQFLSTAAMENAEDPLQRLRVSFEAELAAYEEQGVKLVQAGVLTEDQRQAAIMDRRRAHEQEMTRLMQEEQATRASTILSMEADISTNRYEAERLRLEASLIQRREMILQAVGGDEIAAATKINQLREAGYSRIEQQERDHNARLKALRANQWRENLAGAITGTGALLSLLSSSSEKGFRIQRVAALAQATLNAYTSASEAYKNALKDGGNPYVAAAMAGLASSAQFANVAALRGVSLGGGGGGGASMGGFAGSAAATVREQPFGDAPTVEVIRDSGTRTGVSVNVVNNLGGQAGVEVQESTGANGETMVTLVVDAIAQDIASSGRVAQTMQRRFGLNPRLGVRS